MRNYLVLNFENCRENLLWDFLLRYFLVRAAITYAIGNNRSVHLFETKKHRFTATIRPNLMSAYDKDIVALLVGVNTTVSYYLGIKFEMVGRCFMPNFLHGFDQKGLFKSWNKIWQAEKNECSSVTLKIVVFRDNSKTLRKYSLGWRLLFLTQTKPFDEIESLKFSNFLSILCYFFNFLGMFFVFDFLVLF